MRISLLFLSSGGLARQQPTWQTGERRQVQETGSYFSSSSANDDMWAITRRVSFSIDGRTRWQSGVDPSFTSCRSPTALPYRLSDDGRMRAQPWLFKSTCGFFTLFTCGIIDISNRLRIEDPIRRAIVQIKTGFECKNDEHMFKNGWRCVNSWVDKSDTSALDS